MLEAALKKPMANISINTSLKNPGGYYASTQSMAFRSNADLREAFNEELIHHIQNITYTNGIDQYDKNRGGLCNIEFEAKVLQDILCIIRGEGCFSYSATQTNGDVYTDWLYDATENGTRMPGFTDLDRYSPGSEGKSYWEFLEDFNNDPIRPNYNSLIKTNLEPQVIDYLYNKIN